MKKAFFNNDSIRCLRFSRQVLGFCPYAALFPAMTTAMGPITCEGGFFQTGPRPRALRCGCWDKAGKSSDWGQDG